MCVCVSSLHWLILPFLCLFVQWSIFPTSTSFLPYSSPNTHFERPKYLFTCSNKLILRELANSYLPLPKKCYFHSPLYSFRLTMTSQIESSRLTQYTLLYEKGIKKVEIQSMKTTQIKGERKFSFLICALSPSAKSRTLNLYLSLQPNFWLPKYYPGWKMLFNCFV